ncbi:hypothetical protein B0H67DRAFT_486181 [Lasiosphaeris hirsuta]|uniref:Rhodopsin domain-containing protein n=1 Tax=Lasiosphaeris hirsuta TaxID=260670 RepID=A0AA40ANS6_9PEZI|nr:hypothetical protein B0H67DRAFT_486181 [Lasiosphaeris hirsuta]
MPVPGENPAVDAETTVPIIVGISIAFVAVSTVIVLLRLYTRYVIVRSPGSDDVTIAIAQVLSIGVSVATILQTKYALGRHSWMVSPEDTMAQLKCLLAAMTIYNAAQIVLKMSFLLQYRRIFQEPRTRRVCAWLIAILAAWGVTQEVLVGFACIPTSIFIPSQAAVCIDSLTVWYLTSIMNIVTDFIVFMVPMPAIRSLQLPRRQKVLVASIFCLGFFTCAISIVRLFTLHGAINTTDPTWDNVPSAYWSIVEINCGILCASLPPLRPLLRRLNISGLSGLSGGHASEGYRHQDGNAKRSLSKSSEAAAGLAGKGGVYPLTNVTTGSQEGLHENAAAVPSSTVYRSPDYASRHGGRFKNSRLVTDIKGGNGTEEEDEVPHHHRVRSESANGITVTREIEYEKESMDGKTSPRSIEAEGDEPRRTPRAVYYNMPRS